MDMYETHASSKISALSKAGANTKVRDVLANSKARRQEKDASGKTELQEYEDDFEDRQARMRKLFAKKGSCTCILMC